MVHDRIVKTIEARHLIKWYVKTIGAQDVSFTVYPGEVVDFLDKTTPYNPMQWTIGSAPLFDGTSLGYTVAIVMLITPCVVATYGLFDRSDIAG